MSAIGINIDKIRAELPPSVRLVAVSKYHPCASIEEAYAAGQRLFGENKVQELLQKQAVLPQDIEWHFLGHLQTNKVKDLVPYVSLIHGVDSYRLLAEINKHAERVGRVVSCLLQLHIAQEETKFGLSFDECSALLQDQPWRDLHHVSICGLMGMASNVEDVAQIRREFQSLHRYYLQIKEQFFSNAPSFRELSMGMSHDYPIAVEEGATLIRVGSKIFGERVYPTAGNTPA